MLRNALIISWISSLLALAACSTTSDKTALGVTVTTDYSVPSELNLIRILATAADGTTVPLSFDVPPMPLQIMLVPGGAKNEEITVTAIGSLQGTDSFSVQQQATLRFDPGKAHMLYLHLAKACENQLCATIGGVTCNQGQCDKPIQVEVTLLPPFDPRAPTVPDAAPLTDRLDANAPNLDGAAEPRDAVAKTEVNRPDVPLPPPDTHILDAAEDLPVGTGGIGGMAGTGGTGGKGTETGVAGQTGGNATGGVASSGGTNAVGGQGGDVSTAGVSGFGGAGAAGATTSGDTTIVGGASGGMPSSASGGTTTGGASGGATSSASGGTTTGGASGGATSSASGGTTTGGASGGATSSASGGTTATGGSSGSGGSTGPGAGPCDIYSSASTPCVAAYSMVRVLSKSYFGPLFQVRAGSSSSNNTMSGGTTKDIMPGPDGFVDSATVDAACVGGTYCTVSVLYDHSGRENHLKRAPKGNTAGGTKGALDDYESCATKGMVNAGGHTVYSLYMKSYEGYRTQAGVRGDGMPRGTNPQGTYELADGTRNAQACCWDFGNVTPTPATGWVFSDALCFASTWWGQGDGDGPWFAVDFNGGVWAGGTNAGDPGYGALNKVGPANPNNLSLKVPFALGFLRVKSDTYGIRFADVSTASDLTKAYEGGIPVDVVNSLPVDHQGGIVLGVGPDNSGSSLGTFYEGAIVAGYPTDDTELAVMKNIQAVGYSK